MIAGSKTGTPVAERRQPARIPSATYRLQFSRDFTFSQAAEILDYLQQLGISDVYASPLFKTAAGNSHGYDVCEYSQINPAIGSAEEFERFVAELQQRGMGLVLDMVPNHMRADSLNVWWADVLEAGRASRFAGFFDIDWAAEGSNRILLPVLEDHYSAVLESGKLRMVLERGGIFFAYYDHRFPLALHSYPEILADVNTALPAKDDAARAVAKLKTLAEVIAREQAGATTELAAVKRQICEWHEANSSIQDAWKTVLRSFNGEPGKPRSFDKLDSLLRRQHYRLAFWRIAPEEINYRRFFEVNELVCINAHRREVFEETHRLLFCWVREGKATGIRVDHPDGLWDPKAYFANLAASRGENGGAYVIAEKILSGTELLPRDWQVEGTTGYDFLNQVNALFINPASEAPFDRFYREFTGRIEAFDDVVHSSKKQILMSAFRGELRSLASRLKRIAAATRCGQDITFNQLRSAIAELIAAFPIYRTYLNENSVEPTLEEQQAIHEASRRARLQNATLDKAATEFLRNILLLQFPDDLDAPACSLAREFIMRFQQLTGPVMAKGVEDTAFYRFNRFISLNEVGGNPGAFGAGIERFHEFNTIHAEHWPHSMLATATHDTKRGEDVRARLNVLSEMPAEWQAAVRRWSSFNADKTTTLDGRPAPSANDEYLLYQTLIGAWPAASRQHAVPHCFTERIIAYMVKAAKEAKLQTSWIDPDTDYERALSSFVERILDNTISAEFLTDLHAFHEKVTFFGRINSLAQSLLKIAAPGVPDFYQGTELWDLNLVDPDNRRPVDFGARKEMLENLDRQARELPRGGLLRELIGDRRTGEMKLFLISRALRFRNEHRALFTHGRYVPLRAVGPKAEHVCAFARETNNQRAMVLAPRLTAALKQGTPALPVGRAVWQDTFLPLRGLAIEREWRDIFTTENIAVAQYGDQQGVYVGDVLSQWPVSLLASESSHVG